MAECVPIGAEDVDQLLAFARQQKIDLTVVGPEGPLSVGIVDRFEADGLRIFGASGKAAAIEASKSYSKYIMNKYGVPTAIGKTFTSYKSAESYIKKMGAPIVVKADGLAAGKGVIVCDTVAKAIAALKQIIIKKEFGDAGAKVVVEECLVGEEASFLAFTDGKTVLPLPSSQDHKPIFDGDKGPNTGGMGAYSPAPVVDKHLHDRIMQEVMIPTVRGMAAEGRPYKGVLYAGLMINRDQIKVLEFNGRFGDPEAQPLLMRVTNDIIPIMEAIIDEKLDQCRLEIDPRATVCVVMASGGYPGKYKKGAPISGLDKVKRMKDVFVFHAGTAFKDKQVVAAGGRVLGVTALGKNVGTAIDKAYKAVSKIEWKEVQYRKDIGQKALDRYQVQPRVGIVMGSDSDLPVIGVPIDSSCLQGLDALLSTVQMPPGIPVATVSIGKPGAKNAGILAAQIIALEDQTVAALLDRYKKEMAEQVGIKAKALENYR
jgi:phosphoribosylamine--glycine ligase